MMYAYIIFHGSHFGFQDGRHFGLTIAIEDNSTLKHIYVYTLIFGVQIHFYIVIRSV